ncbi:K02A2.6-like [Cordylochernes scorpioides]|uniref:RNA-directed DNA polymerase n=1 Tax=Cordylochernes scorpioides TaxID=51811 RepID=A0ABY6KFA7_9ARAC|nr:K02A2.6-like [Cordylochernes scorpioides]
MPPATISEWTWPQKPWHRLHLDLAGPFMGRMILVLVDAYSKWIKKIIKDITSKTNINHLREIFTRFGLPEFLATDNGRQFVSGEFEKFTKMNGIRHTKTSPYNPSTNGLAKRYVREFKNLLRKNIGKDDLETNLQRFLFTHRAFPQTVIKEYPRGTANEEKFKIKILEFNTKMGNPREVFPEAILVFTFLKEKVKQFQKVLRCEKCETSLKSKRKRFERYLVVSGMKKKEEADKIDLFMYLMGDRADDIFRTFKFEKEEEATKIDSVLKAFDSHFCVRKNIIYERAKFNSRVQEDREPVDEFITSLYKLADSCEFEGLHEQLIRDRIVVGVRDKALSEIMQLDSELTLEKAVKMVRQQEAVRQQQVDLQRPSTSQKVNQVKFNSKKQSPKQQQQPSRKEKSAKTRSRCPKCGGFTHREGQACRAEGQRCNLCSKTGHFANCCPDKQAKTAEVKAVSELDEEIGFLLEVSAVEDSSNFDDDEGECRRRWTAEIQVNGKKVKFKLDSQAKVTLNKAKCVFGVPRINFLGHILDEDGIRPDPAKIEAVAKMPAPTDVHGVRRFLGMVNHLGRFVENLSEIVAPLNQLLVKGQDFVWDCSQERAFRKLKELLTTQPILAAYDVRKPTMVSSDASSYGLGAVLKQEGKNGIWRPVAYSSRTMTPTEKRYAQIEKEALAITWACERFQDFLLGKRFRIETDHKPLIPLFSTKELSSLTPRLQRFRMRMMRFGFEIMHIPGKELLDADALSRQPLLTTEGGEDERPTTAHINAVLSSITDKDEMLTKNFEAQQEDTTLKAVVNYLEQGWPDKKKMSQALLSYWHVKDELGVQNGLLMRSCRLAIPASMKLEILDKLHAGHFGITKTRLRVRETVWWPGISEEIAETVRKCSVCIQEAVSKHEPLIPTNFPTRPWQKIGMDLFKFENKWYLVVIDYYSRFPEVVQLDRLTANVVVRSCKSIFARHGIPETVVSDNGTQFGAAREFANFARQYGFTHVTSSPRFPQSNGMAEAGVKIAKLILKKNQDPSLGLLEYRSTPLENGYSPAELLMGRKLRTTLPIAPENLNPRLVDSQTLKRKEGRRRKDMKSRYDRRCGATDMEELSEGDTVWITDMRTWGIVKQKASTPRSYMVDTPVGTLRRNRFHLRKGVTVQYPADPSTPTFSEEDLVENEKTPVVDYPSNDSEDGQIRTRCGRIVKPVDRLHY